MTVRHEKMRIAGKLVDGDTGKRIDVLNPFTGDVIGTVPRASRAQIAAAFEIGANYKATLTRYERQKILLRIADIIVER
jgi:acyl-CoA reductase-like NAD-dependent aldehyde dehydrogenase